MSAAALAWAWRQPVRDMGAKFLLIKLADQANDDGIAWPSRRTLADDLGMHATTVTRKVAILREAGLLTVEERRRENGGRTSNLYLLNVDPLRNLRTPPTQSAYPPYATVLREELTLEPRSTSEEVDRATSGNRTNETPTRAEALTSTTDGSPDAPGSLFGPEATSESVAPSPGEPRPATRRTRPQGATQAPPPQADERCPTCNARPTDECLRPYCVEEAKRPKFGAGRGSDTEGAGARNTRPTPRERPRDPIWDELVALFGAEAAGLERGRWNAACKSLRASGATAETLRAAATVYRTHPSFAECVMTPTALAANWTILAGGAKTADDLRNDQLRDRIAALDARYPRGEHRV